MPCNKKRIFLKSYIFNLFVVLQILCECWLWLVLPDPKPWALNLETAVSDYESAFLTNMTFLKCYSSKTVLQPFKYCLFRLIASTQKTIGRTKTIENSVLGTVEWIESEFIQSSRFRDSSPSWVSPWRFRGIIPDPSEELSHGVLRGKKEREC